MFPSIFLINSVMNIRMNLYINLMHPAKRKHIDTLTDQIPSFDSDSESSFSSSVSLPPKKSSPNQVRHFTFNDENDLNHQRKSTERQFCNDDDTTPSILITTPESFLFAPESQDPIISPLAHLNNHIKFKNYKKFKEYHNQVYRSDAKEIYEFAKNLTGNDVNRALEGLKVALSSQAMADGLLIHEAASKRACGNIIRIEESLKSTEKRLLRDLPKAQHKRSLGRRRRSLSTTSKSGEHSTDEYASSVSPINNNETNNIENKIVVDAEYISISAKHLKELKEYAQLGKNIEHSMQILGKVTKRKNPQGQRDKCLQHSIDSIIAAAMPPPEEKMLMSQNKLLKLFNIGWITIFRAKSNRDKLEQSRHDVSLMPFQSIQNQTQRSDFIDDLIHQQVYDFSHDPEYTRTDSNCSRVYAVTTPQGDIEKDHVRLNWSNSGTLEGTHRLFLESVYFKKLVKKAMERKPKVTEEEVKSKTHCRKFMNFICPCVRLKDHAACVDLIHDAADNSGTAIKRWMALKTNFNQDKNNLMNEFWKCQCGLHSDGKSNWLEILKGDAAVCHPCTSFPQRDEDESTKGNPLLQNDEEDNLQSTSTSTSTSTQGPIPRNEECESPHHPLSSSSSSSKKKSRKLDNVSKHLLDFALCPQEEHLGLALPVDDGTQHLPFQLRNIKCAHGECDKCNLSSNLPWNCDVITKCEDRISIWTWKEGESGRKNLEKESKPIKDIFANFQTELKNVARHDFHLTWQRRMMQLNEAYHESSNDALLIYTDFASNLNFKPPKSECCGQDKHGNLAIYVVARGHEKIKMVNDEEIDFAACDYWFGFGGTEKPGKKNDWVFHRAMLDHIIAHYTQQNNGNLLSSVQVWTDNCPTQYKCRQSLFQIALLMEKYGVKVGEHMFASIYGFKGIWDGQGKVIKNILERWCRAKDYHVYSGYLAHVVVRNYFAENLPNGIDWQKEANERSTKLKEKTPWQCVNRFSVYVTDDIEDFNIKKDNPIYILDPESEEITDAIKNSAKNDIIFVNRDYLSQNEDTVTVENTSSSFHFRFELDNFKQSDGINKDDESAFEEYLQQPQNYTLPLNFSTEKRAFIQSLVEEFRVVGAEERMSQCECCSQSVTSNLLTLHSCFCIENKLNTVYPLQLRKRPCFCEDCRMNPLGSGSDKCKFKEVNGPYTTVDLMSRVQGMKRHAITQVINIVKKEKKLSAKKNQGPKNTELEKSNSIKKFSK